MLGNSGFTGFTTGGGGGGGGTTDNSTPIHFVYKADDGTFRDTEATYESGARKTVDTSLIKEFISEDGIFVYKHSMNTDGFMDQFVVSGVLQTYMRLTKLDGDANEDFTFYLGAEKANMLITHILGGEANSSIIIGDVSSLDTNAPTIIWDFITNTLTLKSYAFLINGTNSVSIDGLQTFADNTAALGGGLLINQVYKTAGGELRIVV